MPREVSSGEEGEVPAARSQAEEASKFKCPADFVAWRHQLCSATLKQSLEKNQNELWLIKAPASFDPQRLNGVTVNLSGLHTVTVPADGDSSEQIFNILASSSSTPKLRLLTKKKQGSKAMVLAPAFSGLINLCESYIGSSNVGQELHVIPAIPPPAIPPRLKQRFQPFGSKKPPLSCEVDGCKATHETPVVEQSRGEAEWQQGEGEEEEGRRKKKKKKKDKRIKIEEVEVKTEPVDWDNATTELLQGNTSEERKKKKRKLQEEPEQQEEPTVTVKQEVRVKEEPEDSWGSGSPKKKKKKKKKSKTDDD